LDGRLAQALFSIPGIKGVELGLGFKVANRLGSQVHDEIYYKKGKGFLRRSNNAGGIEGGMTNGEPITLRCVMKPISTLRSPLKSVDILSKKSVRATVERSDICVVPAAGVIGEAVVAIELARAMLEKFGGDSLGEMKRNYQGYLKQVREF
jgi:chorismate synthase